MEKQKGQTEQYIQWYFEELQARGFIESINLSPEPIVINDPIDICVGRKFERTQYTPDMFIVWSPSITFGRISLWINCIGDDSIIKQPFVARPMLIDGIYWYCSFIEVKPDVAIMNAQHATSMLTFPYRQKLVYLQTGIYVQLVKPIQLFKATFTPQRYMKTDKTMRDRKLHHFARTFEDYMRLTDNLTKPMPRTTKAREEERLSDFGIELIEDIDKV